MKPENVGLALKGALVSLSPKLRQVANFYIENPDEAPLLTIAEAAKRIGVSESTFTRLSRTMGFDSFANFRSAFAAQWAVVKHSNRESAYSADIGPDDDIASVVQKMTAIDIRSVEATAEIIDVNILTRIAELLTGAERIILFGIGASKIAADDLEQKLIRIGLPAYSPVDVHFSLTMAALLQPRDVVVLFSHSGITREVIDVATVAHEHEAHIVGITSNMNSRLASLSDVLVTTASFESSSRSAATGSRLAQLLVVDCLFVATAQSSLARSQSALEATFNAVQRHARSEQVPAPLAAESAP
ncbi:MAG: MurR/RpiR family transcriptional regulator [Arcanobacterium sp.]|nr:MurR/RpiR family transcriptional regulator [Arcanobacterium sp.]